MCVWWLYVFRMGSCRFIRLFYLYFFFSFWCVALFRLLRQNNILLSNGKQQRKKRAERNREYVFVANITLLLSVYETVRITFVCEIHHFMVCTWVSMDVIDGKVVCDLCRLHCLQAWNFHKTDDDDDNDYNNDGLKSKTAFWSIHIQQKFMLAWYFNMIGFNLELSFSYNSHRSL